MLSNSESAVPLFLIHLQYCCWVSDLIVHNKPQCSTNNIITMIDSLCHIIKAHKKIDIYVCCKQPWGLLLEYSSHQFFFYMNVYLSLLSCHNFIYKYKTVTRFGPIMLIILYHSIKLLCILSLISVFTQHAMTGVWHKLRVMISAKLSVRQKLI